MDLKRLSNKAKDLVEKRGGTESLKQDAEELRKIAGGKGSLSDKAKAAKEALSRPGGEPVRTEPATGQPPKAEQPKAERPHKTEESAKAKQPAGDSSAKRGDA
jgi:hypothetical protein